MGPPSARRASTPAPTPTSARPSSSRGSCSRRWSVSCEALTTRRKELRAMLRVLVADDSALVRDVLTTVINEDPGMVVVGAAASGRETIRMAEQLQPDLVTMDLLMPDVDGVEATRAIMARAPTPIVIISST